jgi:predicted TPR repeat methyltransferase
LTTEPSALQRAIEAHKAMRFEEAAEGYRGILASSPNDPDALNFLGMLMAHKGDPTAALPLLVQSVTAAPANPHAWINLGTTQVVLGNNEEGASAFTKATEVAPEMPMAWYNLGVALGRCGRPREGASALHRVLKLQPGYVPAYRALAAVLHGLGSFAESAEVFREWLQYEPHNPMAQHMLAALTGSEVPARASDEFVRQLFNAGSSIFDANLKGLKYQAPRLVSERLRREGPADRSLDLLDAGCGTGLCGPLLRDLARGLCGVDLSTGMVEKAQQRGCYDELVVQELCEFMRSRANSFDAVVSADTLCYFGALEDPLQAARRCLRQPGSFVFTLERLDPGESAQPYRLENHGRYAHAESYVREAAHAAGFLKVSVEADWLRWERGAQVPGHIVLVQSG